MYLWPFVLLLATNLFCNKDIFTTLHKCNEESRVTLCSLSQSRNLCRAVVFRKSAIFTQASCIIDHPLSQVYVKTGTVKCSAEPKPVPSNNSWEQSVISRYIHPQYPRVDLALLLLNKPYTDVTDNLTISEPLLWKLENWMEKILLAEGKINIEIVNGGLFDNLLIEKILALITVFVFQASIILLAFYMVRPEAIPIKPKRKKIRINNRTYTYYVLRSYPYKHKFM